MGPEATAELYLRIIRLLQNKYGAKYDSDYPEIIIYNLPLPDVVENAVNQKKTVLALRYGLKKLESAGADFIVAPCNTICAFYPEIKDSVKIPVYSLVSETVNNVCNSGIREVGILGTQLTVQKAVYENDFKQRGVKSIRPTNQEMKETTQIILSILEGKKKISDKMKLLSIIKRMQDSGAKGIVLGCTELPLLLSQNDTKLPLFDTLKILAEFIVLEARIGRSGVEAARQPVELKGRVRAPAAALNKNYLRQPEAR